MQQVSRTGLSAADRVLSIAQLAGVRGSAPYRVPVSSLGCHRVILGVSVSATAGSPYLSFLLTAGQKKPGQLGLLE